MNTPALGRHQSHLEGMALKLHLVATLAMAGVIWTIQLVHYPLMARVGRDSFRPYHIGHSARITLLVGPLMLAELGTGVFLLLSPGALAMGPLAASMALLAVIWVTTALVQVPQHRALGAGYSGPMVRRLVLGNWVRTVAWTARAAVLMMIVPWPSP